MTRVKYGIKIAWFRFFNVKFWDLKGEIPKILRFNYEFQELKAKSQD